MAPVVHGLEKEYAGRVDFLYLNIADPETRSTRDRYGFKATPHFFFLKPDGVALHAIQGVTPADSVRRGLDQLLSHSAK